MIVDCRVFVGRSFDGTEQTVSDLLASMDALGIERALVCPLKPVTYDLNAANAELAAAIRPHGDRLVGAARVDPWQPDAAATLRRGLDSHGLRALYLNPWEEHFPADSERLDVLMGIARDYRVPALVATGFPWLSEAAQVCALAIRCPEVPVVMSNGGQINISGLGQSAATLAMAGAPNLYFDTAGVYRQDFIEECVRDFGADRVLFGSGAPYFDQRLEVKRVQWAKVSAAQRTLMLGENAQRLLRA
jgi:predicted TIM-barrel fold metal-dependent hydrolase